MSIPHGPHGPHGPLWEAARARVLIRDHRMCRYCARPANQIDHIVPLSRGGENDDANLVACCAPCNGRAGSKLFRSFDEKRRWLRGDNSVKPTQRPKVKYAKTIEAPRSLPRPVPAVFKLGRLSPTQYKAEQTRQEVDRLNRILAGE